MKLASILDEKLIFFNVPEHDRRSLYRHILQAAEAELGRPLQHLTDDMIEREDASDIAYSGVAFPHLRPESADDLYFFIARPSKELMLKKNDETPTKLVVMALIADSTSDLYLKALATFVKFIAVPKNLEKLLQCDSPQALLRCLDDANVHLKKNLTAEDMMSRNFATVSPDDHLSRAFDLFNSTHTRILPVVDAEGKLLGELQADQVIRHFIPEYIFMMDHVNFLNSFEAFDRIFREENTESVRSLMQKPSLTISADMPLIQLTLVLVRRQADKIFVVDKAGKVLGELTTLNLIHKVLRG